MSIATEEHEYKKFNPTNTDLKDIELLSNNITKEILEDGREAYSIFFNNKIINLVRIPENFKTMKNEKPFIRMSVVDKIERQYVNSKIDDVAIID